MAKISKYVKLDKNILLEYVYNDGNLISDQYSILIDSRSGRRSYIAGDLSATGNTNIKGNENQLFNLDAVSGKYGVVNPDYYSFLQYKEFGAGIPVRHDTIKIHIPINWTFGEHLGFYIRVYTLDQTNTNPFELSNFYFDMTNVSQQALLNYSAPPLLFQEKLWGKNIKVEIPSANEVAAQWLNGSPKENSINYNLTNGFGLSSTAPVFVDFYFISGIQKVNGVKSYILSGKTTTSVPQAPEFERLALVVEHSKNGDFFEIYGTYNDSLGEFNKFIEDAVRMGHRYYVQYEVTTYEQNIRGKTNTFTLHDGFNEPIEYRPIIKFSTTTAILDVEMRLIDAVDESYIMRRASYGMLQDEVSKYSTNMLKINLANAAKPKVYNVKNAIDASLLGVTNAMGRTTKPRGRQNRKMSSGAGFNVGIAVNKGDLGTGTSFGAGMGANGGMGGAGMGGSGNGLGGGGVKIETIKVPYPVLMDRFNIIGKSDNAIFNNNTFFGNGKMQIKIYPYDNIMMFIIANGSAAQPNYLDMTGLGDIRMSFKSDTTTEEFPLLAESSDIDLSVGRVVFKIPQNKIVSLKNIYSMGKNLFYITATSQGNTSVVYTGLFQIFDSLDNVADLNRASVADSKPSINVDPKLPKETAVVTRKEIKG